MPCHFTYNSLLYAIVQARAVVQSLGLYYFLHHVPKKGATKLMAVTSSNLNRFSKFFYHWQRRKFPIKPCIISHFTLSVLPHYLWEFKSSKFVVKLLNKIKTRIMSKMNVLFIWLNGYYHNNCLNCPTFAPTHMHEDAKATRKLRCQCRSGHSMSCKRCSKLLSLFMIF